MVVIFAARAALTLLKAGPMILRAKPLIFAAKLTPTGQVVGAFVQAKLLSKGVKIGLHSKGVTGIIANKVAGTVLTPLTSGRITSLDTAGEAVVEGIKDIGAHRTLSGQSARDLALVAATPVLRREVAQEIAIARGVPSFLFWLI